MSKRIKCDQCQLLRINGVVCHEIGCSNAWRDEERECKWCGSLFRPESRGQQFCGDDCGHSYGNCDELPGESQWQGEEPPEFDVQGGL